MRDGHRGRSYRGFTVHLGIMPGRHFWIVAAKPDATHRKPGISPTLWNPGLLQEWQRSAAGADENKFGLDIPVLTSCFIPDAHIPWLAIPITAQILHSMAIVD